MPQLYQSVLNKSLDVGRRLRASRPHSMVFNRILSSLTPNRLQLHEIVFLVLGLLLVFKFEPASVAESALTLTNALAAAAKGDAEAQYFLGKCFSKGLDVPQDYAKAVEYFRKAAEQGHEFAQNDLGACYAKGWGVKVDYTKAARWYRKAAEQGDPLAQFSLGRSYLFGRGVPKNIPEALSWLEKAANQNQPDALEALGDIYLNGRESVKMDFAEAYKWCRQAVEHGCIGPLNSLGYLYEQGYAVARSPELAVKYYRQAAEKGNGRGQMNLGRMYQEGFGVPADPVEAYIWFSLAMRNGEGIARHYLEELEDQTLSPQEIREARRRVDEYQDRFESAKQRPVQPSQSEPAK